MSNGETAYEWPTGDDEMSSWQQLLRRLKDKGLRITQMRLQHGKNTVVAYPKADGFLQCYEVRKALFSGKESRCQGIGSIVGDLVFVTFMNATGESWQDIRPLSELRIHSTMDWQV